MLRRNQFNHSDQSEPHRLRAKYILQNYPEIHNLVGKNPFTLFFIVGLVILQVVLAGMLSTQSWLVILLCSYLLGAFISHALFVLIHECVHCLLFVNRSLNRWASILANLPMLLPCAISFGKAHLKHHAFQGIYELDGDLPSYWEAKLIKNYFISKIIWISFYSFFLALRPLRLREIKFLDRWLVINIFMQLVFMVVVVTFLSPKALGYLFLSTLFSIGLHPLGARWVQEHYHTTNDEQETYSYYGKLNLIAFNVGYHNEHHDFPGIPWNRLPTVKQIVPDIYNSLYSYQSWPKLLLKFLIDPNISLYSRTIRENRGS